MFSIAVDRVSKYEYKPTEKDLLAEKKLALKKENKYREKLEKQRRQADEKKTHSIHQAKNIIRKTVKNVLKRLEEESCHVHDDIANAERNVEFN
uniref:Uncharacterized protein n=1 Tax=Timema cristinae TaxID=61476 RepID=A0A7R9D4E1_TIMCR|nr:unnamed protein product [Timema cristinae]